MTHHCDRDGVATLIAALNMLTGKVLMVTAPLDRHPARAGCLEMIDRHTPQNTNLRPIADFAIGKHGEVGGLAAQAPALSVDLRNDPGDDLADDFRRVFLDLDHAVLAPEHGVQLR